MAAAAAEMRRAEWRATRRGMLEVSVILGSYLRAHRGKMAGGEWADMLRLLGLADADLWDLLVAESAQPRPEQRALVERIRAHASETHRNEGQQTK